MALNFLIFFLDRCLHKITDFDVYFWLFPYSLFSKEEEIKKKKIIFFPYFFIYSLPAIHPNVFSKVSVINHVLNDMYHFSLERLGKICLFVCLFYWLIWFSLEFFVSWYAIFLNKTLCVSWTFPLLTLLNCLSENHQGMAE